MREPKSLVLPLHYRVFRICRSKTDSRVYQLLFNARVFGHRPGNRLDAADCIYRRAIDRVDKPSGMLAVPGLGPENRDNLADRLRQEYPDALVVHRLDRDTSGLIVFGAISNPSAI